MGSEGSSTQDKRRHVPLVELLSRMCHLFPTYSKMQCTLDTEASCESFTWMVLPSPRPRVQTRSQSTSFSPMRGPEMKSNSSGAMGTCVAGANVAPDDPFRCAGPWCADLAVSLGADNDPEFSAWSGLPASEALLCGRPAMRMAFCWHKSADRVGQPQGRRELNNNSNSSSRGGAPRPSSEEDSPSYSLSAVGPLLCSGAEERVGLAMDSDSHDVRDVALNIPPEAPGSLRPVPRPTPLALPPCSLRSWRECNR